MFKSNFRLTAILNKDGKLIIDFSADKEDSHRKMYQKIAHPKDANRDFEVPVYGRFYALLYGNGRKPQLIIYGSSSDYDLDQLRGFHQDKYEDQIREFARANNYDLLFLP